jgi:hypothetical protein
MHDSIELVQEISNDDAMMSTTKTSQPASQEHPAPQPGADVDCPISSLLFLLDFDASCHDDAANIVVVESSACNKIIGQGGEWLAAGSTSTILYASWNHNKTFNEVMMVMMMVMVMMMMMMMK